MQVTSNLIDFGLDIQEAVSAPRVHHQWLPDRVVIESGGVSPEVVEGLKAIGHAVSVAGRQGAAHSIVIDARGRRLGATDPREPEAGAVGS